MNTQEHGLDVEIKPRQIEIYEIKLLEICKNKKQIKFEVSCSKGTYIRSLCEDIAHQMDTIGYMAGLERIKVGKFTIEKAISIDEFEKTKKYIPIEEIFKEKQIIELSERKYRLFLNGVKLTFSNYKDGIYRIYFNNKFIGTGKIEDKLLKRDIIL